ncbi:FAD-dependent monooxygenase [Cerasicoccus arenae]|uniref:Oxygenase n=1 Tax=Cerasicoccus arenae TaxID=424488 RepID=A0A8J3GG28_9BACT|nr:FAD-dependent monooxygenase [Cerasicoccus arenae]MBK1858481.1 FAD-dependent monooxygenase [Cerasicoccus arenae]GHC10386.1 oxygenase [Cerasicoccus arenae]
MSSPILIVGAGPVGLCLACELARYGVPFRLIEKRPEASKTSKALGIHARSLEMLEDMGLVDRFIERGLKVHRMNFYAGGKQLTHVNLSEVDSKHNFTLDLPQNLTEALFIERLAEMGHKVERYVELMGLSQDEDGVAVELRKKGGVVEKSTYPYVVGCDGSHSIVRKILGMHFDGNAYPEHFALADVHIDSALAPDEMHMFFHGDGFLILFPMRDKRFRVIATVSTTDEPELDEAYFQQLMDKRTKQQSHISDGIWFSNFRIHHRIVQEYRDGRVFLAGDAAHIHSPAGGQGMNTGMQDAYNLAWKLALKSENLGDLLESYSPERQPIGRGVVELTDRMTKVATMQNPVGAAIRNRLLPVMASLGIVQHKMVDSIEEIDVNYRDTKCVGEYLGAAAASTRSPFAQGPQPGDRAPDAIVTQSESGKPTRLYDLYHGPHYTLLLFISSDANEDELSHMKLTLEQSQRRLGKWLKCACVSGRKLPRGLDSTDYVYLDARLTAHKNYGVTQVQALYLIRPDGYIAFRSLPLDGNSLIAYLNRLKIGTV